MAGSLIALIVGNKLMSLSALLGSALLGYRAGPSKLRGFSLTVWFMQETAINIGFACSLLRNDMTQYIISANMPEILALEDAGKPEEAYALAHTKIGEQLQDALQCMAEARAVGSCDNALVIDGKALLHGLAQDLKAQLLQASS